ncbi:MAG TPA: response regulator transcription factor [Terriglobia bacterium]|nr:response regulator transcription factor [Terriglobia bacterium]
MAGKKTILVVEDNLDLLHAIKVRLTAKGYKVVTAADAVFAVSVALREKPDVILLDIGLPGGDGFLVMQRLRDLSELDSIPVILITAREESVNRKRAFEEHAFAYFQKPFEDDDLLASVQNATGERPAAGRLEN